MQEAAQSSVEKEDKLVTYDDLMALPKVSTAKLTRVIALNPSIQNVLNRHNAASTTCFCCMHWVVMSAPLAGILDCAVSVFYMCQVSTDIPKL